MGGVEREFVLFTNMNIGIVLFERRKQDLQGEGYIPCATLLSDRNIGWAPRNPHCKKINSADWKTPACGEMGDSGQDLEQTSGISGCVRRVMTHIGQKKLSFLVQLKNQNRAHESDPTKKHSSVKKPRQKTIKTPQETLPKQSNSLGKTRVCSAGVAGAGNGKQPVNYNACMQCAS